MILIVFVLWSGTCPLAGDHWTAERTVRLLQEPDHLDQATVTTLNYRVAYAGADGFQIETKGGSPSASDAKSPAQKFDFRSNGTLISSEDTKDPDLERVRRMVWTATEDRKGLSWSRTWPAVGGLIGADVSVKPSSKTATDTTFAVTYVEAGKTKGAATVKVFNRVRIVEDLSLSLNDVTIPGHVKPGSMVVTEKLKEIHLQPRVD
ncbi:MAG: hypothetical protein P4L46_16100 [Fimbriimonas sp.]|nr:hypothetical protein [Fimbriimonas sp.]